MIVRARWRRRPGLQLALAIVVILTGGAVMATVAGAQRTSTAFDRFVAASKQPDIGFDFNALDMPLSESQIEQILTLPDVIGSARVVALGITPAKWDTYQPIAAAVDDGLGVEIDVPRFIEGRAALAVDEMTMDEARAAGFGLEVGDTLEMVSYSPDQPDDSPPQGPPLTLRLVGIERTPTSLTSSDELSRITKLSRAFIEKYRGEIREPGEFIFIDLRSNDVDAFTDAVHRLDGLQEVTFQSGGSDGVGFAREATRFTARALLVLAAIMAVAGAVALYLALLRMMTIQNSEADALRSIGVDRALRRRINVLHVMPGLLVGIVGSSIAAVVASSWFPIGLARLAEPSPGIGANASVLAIGALVLAGTTVAIAALAARHAQRLGSPAPARHGGTLIDRLSRAGAPWQVVTGSRLVLANGRTASASRTAAFGVAFGAAGLTAAVIFAASQQQLADSPSAWGAIWDAEIADATVDQLGDVDLANINHVQVSTLAIDGVPTDIRSYRSFGGTAMMAVSKGRPAGPGEIILGARNLATLGVSIGDSVEISGELGSAQLKVVGQGVFIGVEDSPILNAGAAVLADSLVKVTDLTQNGFNTVLVKFGTDSSSEEIHIVVANATGIPVADVASELAPTRPDELDRLDEIRSLPWVLAIFLAALAATATTSLLVFSVRRQRRDFAVLRTLGLDRLGLREVVIAQSVAVSALGLLIGLPLGVILGRVVWSAVATDLGVLVDTVVPWRILMVVVGAVAVIDLCAALLPARRASRLRPADVLRAE